MAAIALTIIILLNYLAFYYAYGAFEGSVGTKKKRFFSRQKSRGCAPGGGAPSIAIFPLPLLLRPRHFHSHSHFSLPFLVLETQNLEPSRTEKNGALATWNLKF